jgi:hypothetical protein
VRRDAPRGNKKTQPVAPAGFTRSEERLGKLYDVSGLRAFLPLDDFEFHLIAFLQALVALGIDSAVVNENIRTIIAPNESEPFGIVEPLDRSSQTSHVLFLQKATVPQPIRHARVQKTGVSIA